MDCSLKAGGSQIIQNRAVSGPGGDGLGTSGSAQGRASLCAGAESPGR